MPRLSNSKMKRKEKNRELMRERKMAKKAKSRKRKSVKGEKYSDWD